MPTEVDKLDKGSKQGQRDAAISDCIATEIRKGRPQDQAIAMCNSQANERIGNEA